MPRKRQPLENGPRVLLLENDAGVRRSLHMLLRTHGFDVRSHASVESMLADLSIGEALFLVSDYRLDRATGIEALRALRAAGWKRRAVLITASPVIDLAATAAAAGFDAMLEKPFEPQALIALLTEGPDSD
jgi:FixJ family two-component response regulator